MLQILYSINCKTSRANSVRGKSYFPLQWFQVPKQPTHTRAPSTSFRHQKGSEKHHNHIVLSSQSLFLFWNVMTFMDNVNVTFVSSFNFSRSERFKKCHLFFFFFQCCQFLEHDVTSAKNQTRLWLSKIDQQTLISQVMLGRLIRSHCSDMLKRTSQMRDVVFFF